MNQSGKGLISIFLGIIIGLIIVGILLYYPELKKSFSEKYKTVKQEVKQEVAKKRPLADKIVKKTVSEFKENKDAVLKKAKDSMRKKLRPQENTKPTPTLYPIMWFDTELPAQNFIKMVKKMTGIELVLREKDGKKEICIPAKDENEYSEKLHLIEEKTGLKFKFNK